mmetsp:Transcript_1247/g.3337  ORF Transcript_1247/g.3337 Transcript_1247/m.3337 type:complete len:208 (-) Transcript_1247:1037-1660(-)
MTIFPCKKLSFKKFISCHFPDFLLRTTAIALSAAFALAVPAHADGDSNDNFVRITLNKRSNHEMVAAHLKRERDALAAILEGKQPLKEKKGKVVISEQFAEQRRLRGVDGPDGKDENVIIKDYANAQYYGTVHSEYLFNFFGGLKSQKSTPALTPYWQYCFFDSRRTRTGVHCHMGYRFGRPVGSSQGLSKLRLLQSLYAEHLHMQR